MASAPARPHSASRRAARAARASQDWPELLVQAQHIRQESPGDPDGYILAAVALRRLRQRPALKTLLAEALRQFPNDPQLLALAGDAPPSASAPAEAEPLGTLRAAIQDAVRRTDWPAVTSLCTRLIAAAPDLPDAYQTGARAYREQRRLGPAVALSRRGLARFADHPGLLLEHALVLQKQDRLEDALACFDRLRQLQPDVPAAHARSANAMVLLGRFDQAEALLQGAFDRFGNDLELLVQRAILASRRADFALARARWQEVRARAPNDDRLASFAGALTLAEQLLAIPEDGDLPSDPDDPPPAADLTDAELLKRFESLGGNCEFGLVQRAAGIEPLGLLRFGAITAANLTALLAGGLESVGEPAHTRLFLNAQREYMLEDPRFFRSHTLINYGDTEEAALLLRLRRRTRFLRDKLLAELRSATRIFVFRPADGAIADIEIAALHSALRQRGAAPLLCVRNAPEADPAVALSHRGDGLFVATLPHHGARLGLAAVQAQLYPGWITLCRAVLARVADVPADRLRETYPIAPHQSGDPAGVQARWRQSPPP